MRSMLKQYIGYEMDVLVGAAGNRELLNDFCSMVKERIK